MKSVLCTVLALLAVAMGVVKAAKLPKPKTIADIKPPFAFTIRTATPDGKPQVGVKIHCRHPRYEREPHIVDMTSETNIEGLAIFKVMEANLIKDPFFRFEVVDDDFISSVRAVDISSVDRQFDHTFKVLPAQIFQLRVVNDKGWPLEGATIGLRADNTTSSRDKASTFRGKATAVTNSKGEVDIRFADIIATITSVAPEYALRIVNGVRLSEKKSYVIALGQGREIPGNIVDSEGNPMADFVVRAQKMGIPHYHVLEARSDTKGHFVLRNTSEGRWRITTRAAEPSITNFVAPVEVVLKEGQVIDEERVKKTIDLEAKPGFRIKGKCISQHNLSGAFNSMPWGKKGYLIGVGTSKPERTFQQEWTDEQGSFDIWGLACNAKGFVNFVGIPGFYTFVKIPVDYSFFKVSNSLNFENVPPGTYDGIEVHFLLTGRVIGRVTDLLGHGLQGVKVVPKPYGLGVLQPNEAGRFYGPLPPVDNVTLLVRELKTGKLLFESEPVAVREGQIIEKQLAFDPPEDSDVWPSLLESPLPRLEFVGLTVDDRKFKDRRILVCFFDMQQRPSRNCIMRLAKQAEQLKEKGLIVVAVHSSKVDENILNEWVTEHNIPFPVGSVQGDEEKTHFTWGVRSLPWLILTDRKHIVRAEGFAIPELDQKINAITQK